MRVGWMAGACGLLVGDQHGLASKHRLVEIQGLAGLALEVEVGGGNDGHGVFSRWKQDGLG